MLATVLTVLTALTASAQVWTNAPPPVTPPGWTNGTVPPPPWYATVMHTGVVAGVYSNLQFSGRGTQELARIIAALAGSATNGVNSAASVETTSNHVALASNALTVYFKTNYTGGGGTGADTNSVGVIATNAVNQSTNVSARLASNVWAAADSTTNYVRRTGGTYTGGSWYWQTVGGGYVAVDDGGVLIGNTSAALSIDLLTDGAIEPLIGYFAGSGAGLNSIPLTGLLITNTPTAGQVLATSNGTNGYWTTPASGGGSGVATNLIGIGAGSTNLFVITSSNAVLTAGTNLYKITFRP